MKCESKFEDLLLMLDGELDDSKRVELEKHVEICSVCYERLCKLQAMDSCLRSSLSHPEIVPDITGAVMSQIARKPKRNRCVVYAAGITAVAACVVLFSLHQPNKTITPVKKMPVVVMVKEPRKPDIHLISDREPKQERVVRAISEPKSVRTAYHRLSPKETIRPDGKKSLQKRYEQTEPSTDTALHVEIHLDGESSKLVVVADPSEHVIITTLQTKAATMPPGLDVSNIERPPLQTVTNVDPAALLISEI